MASFKLAIAQKCKDCIYDPLDKGTWRQQVEACTSTDCALYQLRPISTTKKDNNNGNHNVN